MRRPWNARNLMDAGKLVRGRHNEKCLLGFESEEASPRRLTQPPVACFALVVVAELVPTKIQPVFGEHSVSNIDIPGAQGQESVPNRTSLDVDPPRMVAALV